MDPSLVREDSCYKDVVKPEVVVSLVVFPHYLGQS